MRKLLTTTALTTGLFAASLAGAGSASAATIAPPVDPGSIVILDVSSAVEAIRGLVTSGCTTQYVNRVLYSGSPVLVSVSGLDITIHGNNALTYTFTQYGSAFVYVRCMV